VEQIPSTIAVEYILNEDARKNDELMAILPPGSLVINATGMGKDRPGSPISDNGLFPERGIVWELNYVRSILPNSGSPMPTNTC
jgi:shikimate dehydrogenase